VSFVRTRTLLYAALAAAFCGSAAAQTSDPAPHQHMQMPMPDASAWMLMQDGVIFGIFNHQGGPRGGDEFKVPNWWMGMATRKTGRSQLTFTGMLSLDPLTVGKRGYGEIFQVGEVVDGRPLVDRQHPHDLFMQLAAVWRLELSEATGLTLAGGPVGEPALGPVAFMHRASAAENPFAPLSHHTFDSTHIAFGVITAAVDHGPFVLEGSVFNGREPDENRWDFDFGRLDSVSARLWYKPAPGWELQVSTGHLRDPEQLEPGNVQRTTASAAWVKQYDTSMMAVTAGYGVNDSDHGTRHAFFAEATARRGATAPYGRFELAQVETGALLGASTSGHGFVIDQKDLVGAFTAGAARDLATWRGFEGALGAAATFYAVPEALKHSHGSHPVSFQIWFRLRPPAPMGRMWNMRMSQPMSGHPMSHQMKP
jgi:hypothetical protein